MTENKQHTRQSIISHLESFANSGVKHVLRRQGSGAMDEGSGVRDQGSAGTTDSQTTNSSSQNTAPSPLTPGPCSSLDALRAHIGNCERCRLHSTRKNIVFGVGNPQAELMFVGEGPGHDEDVQGIPFVGRAGQLLTKIIEAMKFKREDVYIANVVKCRPPENRNPELDEIALCMPFLKEQIDLVKPKVIMCLGKFASQTLLETQIPISKLRGNFSERDGVLIMPTFHPAYLLRNPSAKRIMWEDCKKVMERLNLPNP